MEQQLTKNYVVFSQTMAGYMMLNGCRLIKAAPHRKQPTKNVYYFPDTEYVREFANNYIELRKNA
ncbi:uncharacterized protein YgiM (DUF1202 family) [Virgibacillus natechei]|uniref:Uncharacterized protein YgiM (DUF1202 family) n=1 Tax=Virgibacillus natechei TaxID=1216297 RepID=A0ABS4IBE5_9BACI|nr:DUF5659 domain-containing protein [Virgibacillus natechei]MBP1968000.1 uncharacterized protein YgiM (DUF1202 family) [Virgibacillus natechei]UZD14717.1 hypothetical protein OLD84_09540 [Virgibacillus natechei]